MAHLRPPSVPANCLAPCVAAFGPTPQCPSYISDMRAVYEEAIVLLLGPESVQHMRAVAASLYLSLIPLHDEPAKQVPRPPSRPRARSVLAVAMRIPPPPSPPPRRRPAAAPPLRLAAARAVSTHRLLCCSSCGGRGAQTEYYRLCQHVLQLNRFDGKV